MKVIRRAAEIKGWSFAQLMQRAAIERATEIINRWENGARVVSTGKSLLEALRARPEFSVDYGGERWDLAEEGWAWEPGDPYVIPAEISVPETVFYFKRTPSYAAIFVEGSGKLRIYRRDSDSDRPWWSSQDADGQGEFEEILQKQPEVTFTIAKRTIKLEAEIAKLIQSAGREFGQVLEELIRGQLRGAGTEKFLSPDDFLRS